MIDQVSESLEAFLVDGISDAVIRFERPTDPYAPEAPTVNLFLYEVKENLELRNNEPVVRREDGHTFVDPPPYRVTCMYLVTAWPEGSDPKQEHKLLGQVLTLLAGTPILPADFLTPDLEQQEPPLPMLVVQPDGVRNPAEFWAAIGNHLKPSLLLSVTVSLKVFAEQKFPSVISSEIRLKKQPGGGPLDRPFFRIGGLITDAANDPVVNASVRVVERGRSTLTGADGRFSLSAMPAGTYTLQVTAGALTKDTAITIPAPVLKQYDVQLT